MMKRFLIVASVSAMALASAHAEVTTPNIQTNASNTATEAFQQRVQAALAENLAAVATDPDNAVLHNRLGTCYQRLGKTRDAKREYERAIRLNPRLAQAHNNLATVLHSQRKYAKAVRAYHAAIAQDASMAVAHKNLGTALLAMGEVDEGLAAYTEAQRLDPQIFETVDALSVSSATSTSATQYFCFAKLSARAGQTDAALDFLRKAQAAGFRDFDRVRKDPDFKGLLPDQRFAALTR
jgi:tetratricopeptide (TPR) repeat protein